jgi:N-acetyl-gamma-glutamyl-phosphate reductase
MASDKIRIAIFGGSGYGGSELLRILLLHPQAEVVLVTANEQSGKAVSEVHRNLQGLTSLVFATATEDSRARNDLDCVFLGLPHGQAMDIAPRLPASPRRALSHVLALKGRRPCNTR